MALKEVLETIKDINLKDIGIDELPKLIKDIKVDQGKARIVIFEQGKEKEKEIEQRVKTALLKRGIKEVDIKFDTKKQELPTINQPVINKRKIPGVRKIILVGSGKGGVGKSTVAANIAVALKNLGFKVGLLDADIYGPSVPTIMGVKEGRLTVDQQNRIMPIKKYDIKLVSMGFLLPSEETPVIWRGPILMKALDQFLFDVNWGELDYLILDLPPGTGDVQLSLAQTTAIDGAIVVTTPQDVALADVKKAISMFKETGIPVFGIVENMAYFVCPESNKEYYIFGKGKVAEYALANGLKLLGSIPIEPNVAEYSDKGIPIVEAQQDSKTAKAFIGIAKLISQND